MWRRWPVGSSRASASRLRRDVFRGRVMKSNILIAVSAVAILIGAGGAVEAQTLNKAASEAASLRARVQSAQIVNKVSSAGKATASTQAQKAVRTAASPRKSASTAKPVQSAQKKAPPRGVDQTVTGSVAARSESCIVRKVDLFDRKGNFVKNERMRVCT